jgi:hypothetical protein
MPKATGIILLLVLALTISGCGSNTPGSPGSGNINGTWTATLTNEDGSLAYQFSATFTQSANGGLSVTNFTFTSAGSCFASYPPDGYGESGSFSLTGNSNGKIIGTFGMVIATPNINGPMLTLKGTVNGSTISGTWTASSTGGCSGNGTFTLTPTATARIHRWIRASILSSLFSPHRKALLRAADSSEPLYRPIYRPKYAAFFAVNSFHFSGKSSSAKMADTGHTGTHAPQSMHSTGSI